MSQMIPEYERHLWPDYFFRSPIVIIQTTTNFKNLKTTLNVEEFNKRMTLERLNNE